MWIKKSLYIYDLSKLISNSCCKLGHQMWSLYAFTIHSKGPKSLSDVTHWWSCIRFMDIVTQANGHRNLYVTTHEPQPETDRRLYAPDYNKNGNVLLAAFLCADTYTHTHIQPRDFSHVGRYFFLLLAHRGWLVERSRKWFGGWHRDGHYAIYVSTICGVAKTVHVFLHIHEATVWNCLVLGGRHAYGDVRSDLLMMPPFWLKTPNIVLGVYTMSSHGLKCKRALYDDL